jgi:hypothetical protein
MMALAGVMFAALGLSLMAYFEIRAMRKKKDNSTNKVKV